MKLEEAISEFQAHDRKALSRLLSFAARSENLEEIHKLLVSKERKGKTIALTGAGGVGKSSLIGRLIEFLREKDQKVAVLACDPESPLTGGALLGDRIRMSRPSDDEKLFIRSLATASGHQAIAENLDVMIDLLYAYGFDVVLLETVGAGQGDIAIRKHADVLLVLLQPEAGDDLQWEKAGILEVADIIVINKSDLPGADRVAAQLKNQLSFSGADEIPVVQTSATNSIGLEELWETVQAAPFRRIVLKNS